MNDTYQNKFSATNASPPMSYLSASTSTTGNYLDFKEDPMNYYLSNHDKASHRLCICCPPSITTPDRIVRKNPNLMAQNQAHYQSSTTHGNTRRTEIPSSPATLSCNDIHEFILSESKSKSMCFVLNENRELTSVLINYLCVNDMKYPLSLLSIHVNAGAVIKSLFKFANDFELSLLMTTIFSHKSAIDLSQTKRGSDFLKYIINLLMMGPENYNLIHHYIISHFIKDIDYAAKNMYGCMMIQYLMQISDSFSNKVIHQISSYNTLRVLTDDEHGIIGMALIKHCIDLSTPNQIIQFVSSICYKHGSILERLLMSDINGISVAMTLLRFCAEKFQSKTQMARIIATVHKYIVCLCITNCGEIKGYKHCNNFNKSHLENCKEFINKCIDLKWKLQLMQF